MATTLEPGAEPSEVSATELTDIGLTRIAYSIAISLKRLADATEEMTVIASAPVPDTTMPDLAAIKDAVDALALHASTISTKTTSPEMAALAAKYMGTSDETLSHVFTTGDIAGPEAARMMSLFADIRSLAACVLAQVEPKP